MTGLSQRTPSDSPFAVLYSKQHSTLVCSMGRIKTERQTLLDATRVNLYSLACTPNDFEKTKRIKRTEI